ncbi:MAG: CAP domain-containing protein [Solirubrobacterales bacterium]|nr:CAP domain-containing protein [Solirubrobacterales bacterium]
MRQGANRGIAVAAAIVLSLILAPGAAGKSRCGQFAQAPRQASDHQLRTSVLCLVNRARERRGMAPLRFSRPLRESATGHSRSMVRSNTLTHYGPGGSTLTSRVARSGYLASASSYRLAENIGAGRGRSNGSPLAIVRDWMDSPGHKANILDRGLRDFGVGIARGNPLGRDSNAVTWTLNLGTRR